MGNLAPASRAKECAQKYAVPVRQILEHRATFPGQRLSFEILIETQEASQGLELGARITRTGLYLKQLTYRESGCTFLQLQDDPKTHPQELEKLFNNAFGVSVLRWTTVLGGKD